MGGLGRMNPVLKEDSVNELVIGVSITTAVDDDQGFGDLYSEVTLGQVFPELVEKIKLRKANYTGSKKDLRAFFNTFKGTPQLTVKYGKEFAVFDLDIATSEEVAYNKEHNFK